MPGPRNIPPRTSLRRNTQKEEEPPMLTRSGRGSKSAAKPEKPDMVSPKATKQTLIEPPMTRKATRTTSTVSNYAKLDSAPEVYATYENPYFMVFGLTPQFFDTLKPHKLKKSRQNTRPELPALSTLFTNTEEDESSDTEEESDEPEPIRPVSTRGRGRGGRGSRGPRGRGGRTRGGGGGRGGRGGRGRGGLTRVTSPVRIRPSRNAAPAFPLTEADDEEPSNQNSSMVDADTSPEVEEQEEEVATPEEEPEDEEEESDEDEPMQDGSDETMPSSTPPGEPPEELLNAYEDISIPIPIPVMADKAPLPEQSLPSIPQAKALPLVAPVVRKYLEPEDDELFASDLPDAWLFDQPKPIEAECEDRADFLLKSRYQPLTDVQDIIASIHKHPISQRSTEVLYALAENTQRILQTWQDQFLELDARTAPHAHPPKKPCHGGRIPTNEVLFEAMKEADLYGYNYDPKKPPNLQDPFTQRPGHDNSNGRELRRRRTRDMLNSAAPSEDEEDEDGRNTKRQRRATRPFEGSDQGTGTSTPKKHNGWGGARKKGVSKYAKPTASATATPEPEAPGLGNRGKAVVHPRIQEMRGVSAVASSGDEGLSDANSGDADEQLAPYHKRGRPPGSKNVGRRSDFGRKKGPRKRMHEEEIEIPTIVANPQPPMLQSMSEGQGQFTIDPPMGVNLAQPIVGPHAVETVFQATPQPLGIVEPVTLGIPVNAHTPDTFMNTTPLSQYSTPYMEDSGANSGSGSGLRKKPRVKSEKRSQSMTNWWAERKARQKELDERSGTPVKPPSSTRGRGGKMSTMPRAPVDPQHQLSSSFTDSLYQTDSQPQSFVSSPTDAYMTGAYPPPPPQSMLMQSPLTALPSGPQLSPPGIPLNAQGRALAPAPSNPHIPQSYPSPFGPRTAPRPKSNGPLPLAPAPHISPYGPPPPPMQPIPQMSFKVMVPGTPPAEQGVRKESR